MSELRRIRRLFAALAVVSYFYGIQAVAADTVATSADDAAVDAVVTPVDDTAAADEQTAAPSNVSPAADSGAGSAGPGKFEEGQEGEGAEKAPDGPLVNPLLEIERNLDTLSDQIVYFAEAIDTYFIDDRIKEESNKTRLQINGISTFYEGGQILYQTNVNAALHLPRIQHNLQLELASMRDDNPEDTALGDGSAAPLDAVKQREDLVAALRYTFRDQEWINLSVRSGMQFSGNFVPFVSLRGRRSWLFDKWAAHFAETVGWRRFEGYSAATRIDFERPMFDRKLFFRATPYAVWWDDGDYWDLRQTFTLFQQLGDRDAINYSAGIVGTSGTGVTTLDAGYVNLSYRRRMRREWIYVQLTPQITYPRDSGFEPQYTLTLTVELIFGRRDL